MNLSLKQSLGVKCKNTHPHYPGKTPLRRRDSKCGDLAWFLWQQLERRAGGYQARGREVMRTVGEAASDLRLIDSVRDEKSLGEWSREVMCSGLLINVVYEDELAGD